MDELLFVNLGQGFITTEVLKEILKALDDKLTPKDLDDIIDEVDEDGSGTVDFDGKWTDIANEGGSGTKSFDAKLTDFDGEDGLGTMNFDAKLTDILILLMKISQELWISMPS